MITNQDYGSVASLVTAKPIFFKIIILMSNIDGLMNFNDGAAVGGRSLFIPWGTSKQAAIKMRLLEGNIETVAFV